MKIGSRTIEGNWLKIWITLSITIVILGGLALYIVSFHSFDDIGTVNSLTNIGGLLGLAATVALGIFAGGIGNDKLRKSSKRRSDTGKFFIVVGAVILGLLPGIVVTVAFVIFGGLHACSLDPKCI